MKMMRIKVENKYNFNSNNKCNKIKKKKMIKN